MKILCLGVGSIFRIKIIRMLNLSANKGKFMFKFLLHSNKNQQRVIGENKSRCYVQKVSTKSHWENFWSEKKEVHEVYSNDNGFCGMF